MKSVALALLLSLGSVWSAAAGDLRIEFQDGFVTLSARDVPVKQILAEWARRGQTRIMNGEKIAGAPVTLELTRVPEKQALEVVLHSVAGYLAAPRSAVLIGASAFDRIVVMPTSSAPPAMNAPRTQPPGMAGSMPAYQPQPQVDLQPGEDSDEPVGPQMEQPTFGMPGGEGQGQPMPTGANGFMGNPPVMGPNGNVVVPGAVPPQITPDATNPLRGYQQQPQQQQQQPNNDGAPPAIQPPGPSPMQPGTVLVPNPGQIQQQQPPANEPPQ